MIIRSHWQYCSRKGSTSAIFNGALPDEPFPTENIPFGEMSAAAPGSDPLFYLPPLTTYLMTGRERDASQAYKKQELQARYEQHPHPHTLIHIARPRPRPRPRLYLQPSPCASPSSLLAG